MYKSKKPYFYGASAVLKQMDAGHGGLPTAGAVMIRLLALVHVRDPP